MKFRLLISRLFRRRPVPVESLTFDMRGHNAPLYDPADVAFTDAGLRRLSAALGLDGMRLATDGAARAADHADAKVPSWTEQALDYFEEFARRHATFKTEDARMYAEARGLPFPPDKRAWGQVALSAARNKTIFALGYTTADDPKVHHNPVRLWGSSYFARGRNPVDRNNEARVLH